MTSSLSNREKIRRTLSRRNSRSISWRRLYRARSYSQGVRRLCWAAPPAHTLNLRPVAASHRLHTLDPSTRGSGTAFSRSGAAACVPRGASWACPGDKANLRARSSIRGNQMNLGGPSAATNLPNGLRAVLFDAPVPSGWTLTRVLPRPRLRASRGGSARVQLGNDAIQDPALRPPVHARIDGVPLPNRLAGRATCTPAGVVHSGWHADCHASRGAASAAGALGGASVISMPATTWS